MLLIEIKKDRMDVMREGNKRRYEILTTLLSEVQRLDKTDQENDVKVQAVCKKYVKSIDEMINTIIENCPEPSDIEEGKQSELDVKLTYLLSEKIIVETYLPKQLSENELVYNIGKLIKDSGAESMKDMGKIMKALKNNFDGQYDGKIASKLVRNLLA